MFKTVKRTLLPNPLHTILRRAKKRGQKSFLLGWNRGLGDIALGLFAIVKRIKESIPDAEITFLVRENLEEGFELFEGVKCLVAPDWKRGESYDVGETLKLMGIDGSNYDVVINWPESWWVNWQLGKLIPKLKWDPKWDNLYKKFDLDPSLSYVGMQISAETNYGQWRNWPEKKWFELIDLLSHEKDVRVLLFGFGRDPKVENENVIDLRSKTNLFELLSLVKNLCSDLVLPDSGILSMAYYLDASFPLNIVSLWAHHNHGILKQGAPSPNPGITHSPLFGGYKNLSLLEADRVKKHLILK